VFYGWRFVPCTREDGTERLEQVQLTLEDVLHPQEGDVIPECPRHELERGYLASVFRARLPGLHNGLVLSDCLINWGVSGIGNHSPDVSVFDDVEVMPDPSRGTFYLTESGGLCVLVVELVSPTTRSNDVQAKLAEYHEVGVPLYVIVDEEQEGGPRTVLASTHTPSGYVEVPLTAQGRVELAPLGLCLGLRDNRVVCYDTITGEELGDYGQIREELLAVRRRAEQEAEARATAERQAREADQARAAAEREARDSKRKAKEETKARRAAERRVNEQQERLRQLEEELRRLRGGPETGP
jgi:Uma2 family endonuclease